MNDKYDLPWNEQNHVYCSGCGRKMKLTEGGSHWFWQCPRWCSWWTFFLGGNDKHDVTTLLYYKPVQPDKYDVKTGKKN